MESRILGKTGASLSMVGFGGILVMNETPETARQIVGRAVNDLGLTYFDVAPSYGNAEERLGPALEPYRNGVFLACKTGKRDAAGASEELHASLERMRTDHFDLYQLHAMKTMEDVERVCASDGALGTLVKAREAGKVRFLGFSAHSEEAALTLMSCFDFDSVLFPFNWSSWYKSGFGKQVLAEAKRRGMGILALKALAKRKWWEGETHVWSKTWYAPVDTYEEADLALRFTLSQPITAAVSPGHIELLEWACRAAENFTPLTEAEGAKLEAMSADIDTIFPQT